MRSLRFAYCAIPAFLSAAPAIAQSKPGVSFDQTMVSVTGANGRTDSATIVMHTTSASDDSRIDVEKGNFPTMGPFSAGPHAVVIMRDGGKEIIFLNPDAKQYLSIKPFVMMEGVQKMLESMGGSMSIDTSGSRVELDSVGPGPAIDGHPTLTYRLTTVMRMIMSMMGERRVADNQSTQEIQVATDLGDFAGVATMSRFAEVTQAIGLPKAYAENLAATRRKMHGFPLRAVIHTTNTANGMTRTVVQTIESRNLKRLPVPDSLFVVPGDYKPVTMPVMPGMPAR
jgi:uncharacterized protein DUF4412